MDIKGKVALVTGAGTGVGKGIAIELASNGVKVAINYRSSEQEAIDTKEKIEQAGGEAILIKADVSQREQVKKMVDTVVDSFGGIDILVNNSAVQKNMWLLEYSDKDFDWLMDVNLKGYLLCIQTVLPHMKEKKSGRIINISSIHAKRPTNFDPIYSMTKGGIKMLTREAAVELAKYGITVNSIELGAVDIGIKSGNPRPIRCKYPVINPFRKYPVGRHGFPRDVGQLVKYIASDESEFLTGAAIRLDGGRQLV